MLLTENISIPDKEVLRIFSDPEKSAAAASLIYVSDSQPGIRRLKKGKKFVYISGKKRINRSSELSRIKSIVIPPAWEDVWICPYENGHIQATGIDAKRRKQYRYHPLWCNLRNQAKFYRLYDLGKALPSLRRKLKKHLQSPELSNQKMLAIIVSLMECTCIRIGNQVYERLYGSFGLTTLKKKHVEIDGSCIRFCFKGKKGVQHNIRIRDQKLAALLRECLSLPGKSLFRYKNAEGYWRNVDAAMVNEYIKSLTGSDFSAKEFRTWSGSAHALKAFRTIAYSGTKTGTKRNILKALDKVADHLGNTRTVCKKYYVHPAILRLYEERKLHHYLNDETKIPGLSAEENSLMRILESEMKVLS